MNMSVAYDKVIYDNFPIFNHRNIWSSISRIYLQVFWFVSSICRSYACIRFGVIVEKIYQYNSFKWVIGWLLYW